MRIRWSRGPAGNGLGMSPATLGNSAATVAAPRGAAARTLVFARGAAAGTRMLSFSATASTLVGPAATSSLRAAEVRTPRRATGLAAVYSHRSAGPGHDHGRDDSLVVLVRRIVCLVVCLGRRWGVFGLLSVRHHRQSECEGGNQAGDTDRKELVCTRHSLISLRKGRALSARPPTSTAAGGRPLLLRSATRERVRTRCQRRK